MKKTIFALLTVLAFFSCKSYNIVQDVEDYNIKAETGDLIFQTQVGRSQSLAIQVATLSPYNHVGIVSVEKGRVYVYEASSSVKKVKIEDFVKRKGTGARFVVYRHEDIREGDQRRIISYARNSLGKKYDSYLSWANSRMYCSELAYKAFDYAGYNLEETRKISDMKFALLIGSLIPHNYRSNQFDMSHEVVAPSHLARDGNFEKVFQNW
jgi:hypothetical protein